MNVDTGKSLKSLKGKKVAKSKKSSNGLPQEFEVGEYTVRVEEYKGRPSFGIHITSRIEAGESYTLLLGMGVAKCRAVVKCMKHLQNFVDEFGGDDK